MATKSSIEWTGLTWNPTVGCSKQSPGCKKCYAMKMAYRLMHIPAMAQDYAGIAKKTTSGINWTGKVTCLDNRLIEPLMIKKPSTFFVNSMSDLFHPEVPFDYVAKVFVIMALTPQHTYQILTKQSKRMVDYFKEYENGLPGHDSLPKLLPEFLNLVPSKVSQTKIDVKKVFLVNDIYHDKSPLKNVWLGVSVENNDYIDRVDDLIKTPASVRFISYEPALGPIDLSNRIGLCDNGESELSWNFRGYKGIDWIICGGESGSGKDVLPMHPDWARSVRDQCKAADVPFFFKQWGKYLPQCQAEGVDTDGYKLVQFPSPRNPAKMNSYYNMGKHNAGSKLDGKEHKEFPGRAGQTI